MPIFVWLIFGWLLSPIVWAAEPTAVSTRTIPSPVIVDSVTVQGNLDVSTHVIKQGLELWPGRPYSPEKTTEGQQALYASGCFDTLDIAISTSSPTTVHALVQVKERESRYLRGGVGYGSQTKERITAGYEDHNFFGGLRQLDIKATVSGFITEPRKYFTRIIETNLSKPYLFDTRMEGQISLSEQWDDREAYDSRATTLRTSLLRRFSKALDGRLRYRLAGTHLTRVSPEAETPDQTLISALGPTFTYDVTDDRFLPTEGWRLIGTWEEGLRALGGDIGFHKLEGRTGRFDTFAGWTFFEGLQAGEIVPHAGQTADVIPIYERYFLGGANTVRGFSERDLGPRDAEGNPLGGEAFLVTNFEIRHKLYKKVSWVTFFDAGQLYTTDPGEVWPSVSLDQLDDLRYSSGLGIRLNTPVGALRLELGYQLNPPVGTSFFERTQIHFSIGEVF